MKRLLIVLISSLILAGCGSDGEDFVFTGNNPQQPPLFRIGVLAPLEAGNTEFGLGIRNSAQLAVNEWNATHPNGPLFELVAFDDSSDPAVGLAAAEQMVGIAGLVGVVGTYNSGVAQAVLPTFEAAGIPMLSPGNTNPALTLGDDLDNPVRPFDNYFRLVVPDNLQGPALAEYAFSVLGVTQVGVLTENKAVSQGLADAFSQRFVELGGTITLTRIAPDDTSDYSALLDEIALTTPQLLFYAGEVPNASLVREQATAAGIVVPMMGGDGMKAQVYIDDAGVSTEGDVASSVGAPAELLPSAAGFVAAYTAAGFDEPPSDFGPYAYDAANLLIAGALTGGGDRGTVLAFLESVDSEGATGRLSFDSFGDTLNKVLTVYVVQGGVFLPDEIVEID